jgi:hypothetical protein
MVPGIVSNMLDTKGGLESALELEVCTFRYTLDKNFHVFCSGDILECFIDKHLPQFSYKQVN